LGPLDRLALLTFVGVERRDAVRKEKSTPSRDPTAVSLVFLAGDEHRCPGRRVSFAMLGVQIWYASGLSLVPAALPPRMILAAASVAFRRIEIPASGLVGIGVKFCRHLARLNPRSACIGWMPMLIVCAALWSLNGR
jgi:hypothetical protein